MAQTKGKAAKAEKAPKKERVKKDTFLKDNYVVINDFRVDGTGVLTSASHIRSVGTQVREEAYQDGKLVGVSSNFIPGVKVKTKKDWKFLTVDKGPKSKKEEAED